MTIRHLLFTTVISACFAQTSAWAEDTLPLEVRGAYDWQHDSNFFRLSGQDSGNRLGGLKTRSENIGVATIGLGLDKSYSLQRLQAIVSVVDYRYQNNDFLSFTAANYDLTWHWSLTPRLRGKLGTERRESASSYADLQNVSQANRRTTVSNRFDGEYAIDGAWSATGGLGYSALNSDQPLVGEDDYRSRGVQAGVRRIFASGTTVSYSSKKTQGRYLNRELSLLTAVDDGFDQWDHGLKFDWALTGKSTASLNTVYIKRSHPNFSQRDFSGWTGLASMAWSPSNKTSLTLSLSRDLTAYQTASTNYARNHRLSISPTWEITSKVALRFRHNLSQIDFQGSPNGAMQSDRQDTLNESQLNMEWRPTRQLILSASLQRIRRTSNLAGLDFSSNQAALGAQVRF